jgi:predicted dehydrogenase
MLSGLGQDVVSLAAFTALAKPDLAPVDTVHAILATEKGRSGTFSVSFGSQFRAGFEMSVVTTKGRVVMAPNGVTTTRLSSSGEKSEATKEFQMASGVPSEVEVFVASIESGSPEPRASPQQALKDLRIIQSMLESADEGGTVKAV